MHPCSKHWHLIDYVIVRKRDRKNVRVYAWCSMLDRSSPHHLQAQHLKSTQETPKGQDGSTTAQHHQAEELQLQTTLLNSQNVEAVN